ncbi:MAG: DUF2993 domain-containing protein, partial [Cyanobacteria bacterium P01_G01_bin.38]
MREICLKADLDRDAATAIVKGFTSTEGLAMSDNSGMGEQAINKIAEAGLRTQLDEVEALTVNVDISPEAIAGGEIDAVTIEGEGLVLQDDLRTEKLRVKTGPIAITPWKAVFGNIELKQTVKAQAEITLTEQDINDALNLDYLK